MNKINNTHLQPTNITKLSNNIKLLSFLLLTTTIILSILLIPASQTLRALSINSLSQTQGDISGGDEITISGEDFILEEGDEIVDMKSRDTGTMSGSTSTTSAFLSKYGHAYVGYSDISETLNGERVISISADTAITESGKVFAWTRGGHSPLTTSRTPVDVSDLFENKPIKKILTNNYYNYALTEDGTAFSWGSNLWNIIGQGNVFGVAAPTRLASNFDGEKITYLYNGKACTENNRIYTWGGMNYNYKDITEITDKFAEKIVSCSDDGWYTGESGERYHYTVGDNEAKKLSPMVDNEEIDIVAYPFVSTKNGRVFWLGEDTEITDKLDGEVVSYGAIRDNSNVNENLYPKYGKGHIIITDKGSVYSWGQNGDGKLGYGDTSDRQPFEKLTTINNATKVFTVDRNPYILTSDKKIYGISNYTFTDITPSYKLTTKPIPQISKVTFDTTDSPSFEVIDKNTIKAIVPPHSAGKVNVTLTSIYNETKTLPLSYEYIDNTPPVLPPKPEDEEDNNNNEQAKPIPEEIVPMEDITVPNTGVKYV